MELPSQDQFNPNSLLLASSESFSTSLRENDLVWALDLNSADTPLFCLHSTFGLRAKSIRLIPNLYCNNQRPLNSQDFKQLPTITQFTTSTLQINCTLNIGLQIQFNLYLPESDVLTGRITVENPGNDTVDVFTEIALNLIPMDQGQSTRPVKSGGSQVVAGQAENLHPVLFMNGGPDANSNPYPALRLPGQIPPGKSQIITWTIAAKTTRDASIETARRITGKDWQIDAQKQIMNHAKNIINIRTGNSAWNSAFLHSQTNARLHLVTPQNKSHTPVVIRNRLPDQSPSIDQTLDELDDLTTLEALHLAKILLPSQPEIIAGLVERFLSRINDQGLLTSRLNTSPFISTFQECPLLATLCLQIYEINLDKTFLQRVFPTLSQLLSTWIRKYSDTKNELIPTWENPQQCQLDTGLFNFDICEPTGNGVNILIAESPALTAMFYREVKALNRMAEILNIKFDELDFHGIERSLKRKISHFWCEAINSYSYLDKQSHLSQPKTNLAEGRVQKEVDISSEFSDPIRLQLHLFSTDHRTKVGSIQFRGKNPSGEPQTEIFKNQDIRWVNGIAHLTSQNLYSTVDSISLIGLNENDRYKLETADLTQPDITCLLPVWSGGVSKKQLNTLLKGPLNPQNPALQFGIPETWSGLEDLPEGLPVKVNVMWNSMIIEGLSQAGANLPAMQLFSTLMATIVKGLKDYNGFYTCYDSLTGFPCGQQNTIAGLVPIQLFLQIAGIKLFTPTRVAIWGVNPFTWPVEVHWQGLYLRREGKNTHIFFPDGTEYEKDTQDPVLLTTDVQDEITQS